MPTTHFCAFCQTSGFPSPHDHFVRASRDPSSAVTCPRLLATECSYCRRTGHTAKYCGERQFAERQARQVASKAKNLAFEAGEWMERPTYHKSVPKPTPRVPENPKLTSHFAALTCDSSSDSEQDPEPETPEQSDPSWADVAKRPPFPLVLGKRPEGMSWADWDDED